MGFVALQQHDYPNLFKLIKSSMLKLLKFLTRRKRFKSYILNDNFRIVEAFSLNGKKYFCFDDAYKIPTGRAMSTLSFYEEMKMNCDKDYLEKHIKAVEIILSDPKKININALALIHNNLKERTQMVSMPDYIYKMASVMYFDESESPYVYDWKYNDGKIKAWRESPDTLIFFLKGPLTTLMPSINLSNENAQIYFNVADQLNRLHHTNLSEVLSKSQ